ncbi:MAG TPA: hypothetical protein VJV96_17380 [Candidatus Angelobacter sp.]|nr:hypothetical protein [Candidatus Angelobacter sp.]
MIQTLQSLNRIMQKKRPKPLVETPVLPAALPEVAEAVAEELWVRPNYNLRQERRRQSDGNVTPESGQRLLELADIALGLKKPAADRRRKALSAEAHHQKMLEQKRKKPRGSA